MQILPEVYDCQKCKYARNALFLKCSYVDIWILNNTYIYKNQERIFLDALF